MSVLSSAVGVPKQGGINFKEIRTYLIVIANHAPVFTTVVPLIEQLLNQKS